MTDWKHHDTEPPEWRSPLGRIWPEHDGRGGIAGFRWEDARGRVSDLLPTLADARVFAEKHRVGWT